MDIHTGFLTCTKMLVHCVTIWAVIIIIVTVLSTLCFAVSMINYKRRYSHSSVSELEKILSIMLTVLELGL